MLFSISGYYNQTATITNLEEYWQYKFLIEASTSVGTMASDMSSAKRTKYAGIAL